MPISESNLEAMFSMESDPRGVVDEPPFRILVLGDWTGNAERKDLISRRPIEIDRDNFDEVMRRVGTSLELDLQGDGSNSLPLSFSELDDFHPDRIFDQVPLFSELRTVRKKLSNQDTFYEAAHDVRTWFPVPDEPVGESSTDTASDVRDEAVEPGDLLSHILSQPAGGGAMSIHSKTTESREFDALLKDLVWPHLVKVDESEQSRLIAVVDSATGDLMRKILHNRKFQTLEAAWRGLYFMVRRTETDTGLSVHILDITKEELAENLRTSSRLSDTLLYKTLITDALETPGAEPWALILGSYAFAPNVDDVATLVRVSKLAADSGAPFVSHIRPDILGLRSLEGNTDPKSWNKRKDTDAGKLWSALRSMPESEYVGLMIPRFLARLPYGADTEPLESFSFEEFPDAPVHDNYLWANSCFACGLLLAQSYSEHGWEMGRALIQDLDGLPIHIYKEGGETIYKSCAEVQLTDFGCDELMEYGLMPLVSYKNTDHAKLARFQSITDPVTGLKARWN